MNRTPVASAEKILSIGILALLLFCAPMHLAAQERETRATDQSPALAWFTSLWSDLTAWLTGEVMPPQPELPPGNNAENGCAIDPNGGCGG